MAERVVGTGSFGVVYQVFIFDLQYFFICICQVTFFPYPLSLNIL